MNDMHKLFEFNPEIAAQVAAEKPMTAESADLNTVAGVLAQSKAAESEMLDVIEAQHGLNFRAQVVLFVSFMGMHSMIAIALSRVYSKDYEVLTNSIAASRKHMEKTMEQVAPVLMPDIEDRADEVIGWAEKVYAIQRSSIERVAALFDKGITS